MLLVGTLAVLDVELAVVDAELAVVDAKLAVVDAELEVVDVERDSIADREVLDESVVGDNTELPTVMLGEDSEDGEAGEDDGVPSGRVLVKMLPSVDVRSEELPISDDEAMAGDDIDIELLRLVVARLFDDKLIEKSSVPVE